MDLDALVAVAALAGFEAVALAFCCFALGVTAAGFEAAFGVEFFVAESLVCPSAGGIAAFAVGALLLVAAGLSLGADSTSLTGALASTAHEVASMGVVVLRWGDG